MITIDDINVQFQQLPAAVKALTRPNEDDSYTVILNSSLNYEQQQESYVHELKHILSYDYEKSNADAIERRAHAIYKMNAKRGS